MKKEFLVERQGKQFVLYAGLLELAHEKGLVSITTSLLQVPEEENGNTAIVTAIATLDRDGKTLSFTGIGDAAPNNVAPAMRTCLLRMAETRAKARALRDAVNIGVAALEELGEETDSTGNEDGGYRIQSPKRAPASRTNPSPPTKAFLNETDEQCPRCYALPGKPHVGVCLRS